MKNNNNVHKLKLEYVISDNLYMFSHGYVYIYLNMIATLLNTYIKDSLHTKYANSLAGC